MSRIFRFAAVGLVATTLLACGAPVPAAALDLTPRVQVQQTDYRADRATFRTRLLRRAPSPQSGPPNIRPPAGVSAFRYPSGDLTLTAWIGKPATTTERMPVVIFLHGGFAFGADDFDMARPYLEAGYVVVTPLLRGENGQGGAFSMFYDEVDDVLAVTEHVSKLPYIDASKIYLAGHSVGGTMAMLSGMASGRYRAVAALSGSPDQILFTQGSWGRMAPYDLADMREQQMRSPLAYPASFKSPTRLYYGSQELFFDVSTRRLATLARAAGLDVEARAFPGDHFSAVPAEIADSIAFFRKHS